MLGVFPGREHRYGRVDLVHVLVPQRLQHGQVVRVRGGLLEDGARAGDDDGVGGDNQGWVRDRGEGGLDGGFVHVQALLYGSLQDVFKGRVICFGEVLGLGGGEDFEICETDLSGRKDIDMVRECM